jgi:hypothetical protein
MRLAGEKAVAQVNPACVTTSALRIPTIQRYKTSCDIRSMLKGCILTK